MYRGRAARLVMRDREAWLQILKDAISDEISNKRGREAAGKSNSSQDLRIKNKGCLLLYCWCLVSCGVLH